MSKLTEEQLQVINQYKQVLENAEEVINKQKETIVKGIELRMFCSHIQKFLQDINQSGNLDETINNLAILTRSFDTLALEYGPYPKTKYIDSVIKPFVNNGNGDEVTNDGRGKKGKSNAE